MVLELDERARAFAEENARRMGLDRSGEPGAGAAGGLGYAFMQFKTVQIGRYEDYDRTNLFYRSLGFREFEVFPDLWDQDNPCQIYVMSLKE